MNSKSLLSLFALSFLTACHPGPKTENAHGPKVEGGRVIFPADSPLAIVASPEYGQAQSEAARAMLDLSLAEQTVKRLRELSVHGAVPQKELHAAEIELNRVQSEVRRASGRLALYGTITNEVNQ